MVENWKIYSYSRSFSLILRSGGNLPACFPVISANFLFFLNITAYFQVVEKVKKRELSYKKRWGKCAESEAVDFKIVL
jgi:hypothetical protein